MSEIKLIKQDTDISKLNIHLTDWDVVVHGRSYQVAFIEGYVHSIGGKWGNNDLWMWPRGEEPCYENLCEYSGDGGACWGIKYQPHNYFKTKWGETECRTTSGAMITRNGEDFYFCSGIDEARYLINVINEHPLDLNFYDYVHKIEGIKVWWRSQPAIIRRWVGDGQACVMLEPDGIERFSTPPEFAHDEWMEDSERSIKTDIFDKHIWWFRS